MKRYILFFCLSIAAMQHDNIYYVNQDGWRSTFNGLDLQHAKFILEGTLTTNQNNPNLPAFLPYLTRKRLLYQRKTTILKRKYHKIATMLASAENARVVFYKGYLRSADMITQSIMERNNITKEVIDILDYDQDELWKA